ncbi:MAG TPA: 23S rRNA (pseudouridine(1915)-N(3))-methyltransferase RlmH [Microbacteriaceae bacterium]|nr:23S rRNA (pseudouridine(1915)-N(3))-methyltransferase RlmH [Microbacteriaceae bacterium]
MVIRILAVGKRHESWVGEGITRYESRLRKPFQINWQLVAHSQRGAEAAREEESDRILNKIKDNETVVLLDERGTMFDSFGWAQTMQRSIESGVGLTIVIGGSYGVDNRIRERAKHVWSLSNLVFPHQLVRLMLVEQIYRAQEILSGGGYHHA